MDEQAQLDHFIDRYSPEVASDARQALHFLGTRLSTATRLVYDNYNALAVAFGPSERASEAILSVALYPSYVTLFFSRGVDLEDPHSLLEGEGAAIRSVKLRPISRLMTSEVHALIEAAVAMARPPLAATGRLIIKSIAAKQRPRRPSA